MFVACELWLVVVRFPPFLALHVQRCSTNNDQRHGHFRSTGRARGATSAVDNCLKRNSNVNGNPKNCLQKTFIHANRNLKPVLNFEEQSASTDNCLVMSCFIQHLFSEYFITICVIFKWWHPRCVRTRTGYSLEQLKMMRLNDGGCISSKNISAMGLAPAKCIKSNASNL